MKPPNPMQARSRLIDFLYGCTAVVLAEATVPVLTGRYGVDAKTAEYELQIARQKRAGQGA